MPLAQKLKKLRLKSGKSLQQAADAVEVSKAHIFELESGNVKNPSVEILKKLAKLFEVPVSHFIDDDEDVEFQIMFRNLQKNYSLLRPEDQETIDVMIEVLAKKRAQKEASEN